MKKTGFVLLALLIASAVQARKRVDPPSHYDRAADPHGFTIFMPQSGWCWFEDPRAILQNGYLVIGAVQGNGSGAAKLGSYDLKAGKRLGCFVAQDHFDRDDHDSPVFYARPDGSLLTVYAKHGREKVHYYRISESPDFTQWGPEKQIRYGRFLGEKRDNVSYMNLYNMSSEGLLYNFFRGKEYNPSFVTSTDAGQTWGQAVHFIKSEIEGRNRPYARYAGNGTDTVHVSFTDGHPHDFGNSIYYTAFRNGNFYRADGTLLKSLADGPLRPSESELVYQGGGKAGKTNNAAWTSSMVLDANGYPHIGYTLHTADTDHRYRIASWDGSKWIDREVAYGGNKLYERQTSYTGLITLDPKDPSYVVISSDVNPSTGEDLGGNHEIYRANVGLTDDVKTVQWTAVTQHSPVQNIRPIILNDGHRRVVLWNRGDYQTYKSFDLDAVGYVEKVGK